MGLTLTALVARIPTLQAGQDYLAGLPRNHPAVATEELLLFLDTLSSHPPPPPGVALTLLEEAAPLLSTALAALSREYQDKPLPLATQEERHFQKVLTAWQKLDEAYAHCLASEQTRPLDAQSPARMALLLHRRLHYRSQILFEHYLARRELPAGLWLSLHPLYQQAERKQLIHTPVTVPGMADAPRTDCSTAYARALLVELASPYSHSLRSLNLILRWSGLWAPRVTLHAVSPAPEHKPSYLLNLDKDAPLLARNAHASHDAQLRCVDTSALEPLIQAALVQLRQRISPAQLGLGEENASHVIRLLEQLRRPWTQRAATRQFRRFAAQGSVHVAAGFEAMHFHISGTAYEQPDIAQTYSRREYEQLFTFRDPISPQRTVNTPLAVSHPLDEWTVINHSANGFRLARSSAGQKLIHGQLLALLPHDGEHFLLARATWLMQDAEEGLVIGVAMLPGMPRGIGLRLAEASGKVGRFQRAFLLPAVPAIHEEGSMVLPDGLYQASRTLEVDLGDNERGWVRMGNILHRGPGFDRISFTRL